MADSILCSAMKFKGTIIIICAVYFLTNINPITEETLMFLVAG